MKTLVGVVLVSGLLASGCAHDSTVVVADRFAKARGLILEQVTNGGVPSIAVAVAQDGEIIWEEAFGWSDVENRVRATPHTMFGLGSISKTITATGLMLLMGTRYLIQFILW